MIAIESKRRKRENILKKYPDAVIADVTSQVTDGLVRLSRYNELQDVSYMNFFLQNNITIVTAQDSYLIISCLRVTLKAFSNVTHATRCHATAKKTDLEVFEPTMWEKEARHIGGQEIKTATLFNA